MAAGNLNKPKNFKIMQKQIVTVTFPIVNKNNTLAENFEAMVMYGTNSEKCEIKKTVELNKYRFNGIANSLLENRNELWEQIGGAYSDAPEFKGLTSEQVFSNPQYVQIFRDTCIVQVVEVKCIETGKAFYVNTEGYDYARYVGVITENNKDQ